MNCAAAHAKENGKSGRTFAAGHTRECALKPESVASGYAILIDLKLHQLDSKGNELAKALFQKQANDVHQKFLVEGIKRADNVLVDKMIQVE